MTSRRAEFYREDAMEALQCYGSSSDEDVEDENDARDSPAKRFKSAASESSLPLPPPPPPELLKAFPDAASTKWTCGDHGGRVRSFPHVAGNYALHVYVPVTLPASTQTKLAPYLQKAVSLFPGLKTMDDDDLSASVKSKHGIKLTTEFHISLGLTVPIRIHQADTMVHMLRRKFQGQKQFWIEFSCWEVFVNDDKTRSFLSLEVLTTGFSEIKKQVTLVNDVYRLHGLPSFYPNPRPHISLAWALGDVMGALASVAQDLNAMARLQRNTCFWSCPATKVECRIGQKLHSIWASQPTKQP